jgi:peptide/nickel transport system permease protein
MKRLLRDRLAVAGLVLLALFALLALAAPLVAPYDPAAVDPSQALALPSRAHWLGTDELGRDLLSRLLFGSRWSLGATALATALILAVGVGVGAVAGYYGGAIDEVLMRVVDAVLAFPALLLALAIAGAMGPGMANVMLALVAVWWASYARVVRGLVLAARERPYIEAVRSLGATDSWIVIRHILPNVLPPVAVLATLEMGQLVLALAALNFLGLGAQPPAPEWGAMLNDARVYATTAPQLMVLPGLAITLVVVAFNLLGDGLRDVLDPRQA